MPSKSLAFLIATLMVAASVGTIFASASRTTVDPQPIMKLDATIPTRFGNWQVEPQRNVRIIHPGLQATLDEIYSQVLERIYVNTDGYRIMLSVAYGADQRGSLMAHDPEGCYTGQGFTVDHRETSHLVTPFGQIPVSRLFMSKGARVEPVSYWIMIGDQVPEKWQSTLVRLSYAIRGRVPDGLIFRVSSIDGDRTRAIQLQDQFINELVMSVPSAERRRLSGVGHSKSK